MTDTDALAGDAGDTAALMQELGDFLAADKQPESKQQQKQLKSKGEAEDEERPVDGDESEPEEEAEGKEQEEAEEEQEESESEEDKLVIDIDGQERQYTLKEAAKLIQRAEHYEKKTQSLRAERETLERESQQYRQAREQMLSQLERVGEILQREGQEFAKVNWAQLADEDPTEYVRMHARHQQWQQAQQMAQAERQKLEQTQQQEQTAQLQQYVNQQAEALLKQRPEFAKRETQERFKQFLIGQGFTEDQIPAFFDHRVVTMIDDARRYREAQKKGVEAGKQPKAAPKLMRPGAKQPSASQSMVSVNKRINTAKSDRDLASVLADFL